MRYLANNEKFMLQHTSLKAWGWAYAECAKLEGYYHVHIHYAVNCHYHFMDSVIWEPLEIKGSSGIMLAR